MAAEFALRPFFIGFQHMSDMLIKPRREKGEPQLAGPGLLLINPAEAAAASRWAQAQQGREHFLFNSRLFQLAGRAAEQPFFLAGPAVGAPMAVLTLEKLRALGAQRLIVYGWCGSLCPTLRAGDVLLPTWAVSGEGTSGHYPLKKRPESARRPRRGLLDLLARQGLTAVEGPIWTTDAPYREGLAQVEALGGQGVLGVDMEFAALCTVAAFRQVELAAVLLVSDELRQGGWQPAYKGKAFKAKSRAILQLLLDYCRLAPPAQRP